MSTIRTIPVIDALSGSCTDDGELAYEVGVRIEMLHKYAGLARSDCKLKRWPRFMDNVMHVNRELEKLNAVLLKAERDQRRRDRH